MKCASKKRHWARQSAALDRLEQILDEPLNPNRMYVPTGVTRCTCGQYVLTSDPRKPGGRRRNGGVTRRKL